MSEWDFEKLARFKDEDRVNRSIFIEGNGRTRIHKNKVIKKKC